MQDRSAGYLEVFKSRKMAALLVLGFSSGLPLYFTSKTAQAWMTLEKVDLSTIGFMSLAGLPYSLKFVWSPLVDRFPLPFAGRRLGWVVLMQALLALAVAAAFFVTPSVSLRAFAAITLFIALAGATQDIAFDAYKIEVLEKREFGAGVALSVLGYRAALIASGSLAFVAADRFGWPSAYLGAAVAFALLALSTGTFFRGEGRAEPPASFSEAVTMPFAEFFGRLGVKNALLTLVFIVIYKFGDSLVSNMSTSFLMLSGYSQTEIGAISGGIGIFATMAGVVAGGAYLSSAGIKRSLIAFGALQAASNLCYYGLFVAGKNSWLMAASMVVENICAGLGTAAFVAFIMSMCSKRYSATQYALLTSLMAAGRDVMVAPAGKMVEHMGFGNFFLLTVLLAVPGTVMVFFIDMADDVDAAKKAAEMASA